MGKKKIVEISAAELKKLQSRLRTIEKRKEKKSARKFDGYNPYIKQQIRNAIREIWRNSAAWKIAKNRVLQPDGMSRCEECNNLFAKTAIDHIIACGELDSGFIDRMFVPSIGLKSLCGECHSIKSSEDRKKLADKKSS